MELSPAASAILSLLGLDKRDWHQLDHYVSVIIGLDASFQPMTVTLAQHFYHRTYIVGQDIHLDEEGRMLFDIAQRSNEIYIGSLDNNLIKHPVAPSFKYIHFALTGKNAPLFHGFDVTYGINAGGKEVQYDLEFLDKADAFYTSEMILGQPRPFAGVEIGRTGPPGADYFAMHPDLLNIQNLVNASYFEGMTHDEFEKIENFVGTMPSEIKAKQLIEFGKARISKVLSELNHSNLEGDDV